MEVVPTEEVCSFGGRWDGTLQKELAKGAQQTHKEMEHLQEVAGLTAYDAWDAVRERCLILPCETD